ncbi:MAG: TonB-dependent receptor [Polyangiaceae bacterium]|nr:TonB-dependent receptor [Polyangiaceae bacterium]
MRLPISYRDPTAASTVISGSALRAAGRSTADALAWAPGIQVVRTGSGADMATASLRGASSAQTPVLLAGVPLNESLTGTADLSLVPLWMVDRVEVYRGNAPEFADQFGIGGGILFEPRVPRKAGVGGGVGVGSFGEISGWVGASTRSRRSGSLVAVRHARARNDYPYTDDMGTRFDSSDDVRRARDNADFSSVDAWAVSKFELDGGGQVTLVGNAFEREQGVTGLAVVPARHTRALSRRVLGGVSGRIPCSKSEHGEADGPCVVTLSGSAVVSRNRVDDPFREFFLPSNRLYTDSNRFTQQVRYQRRVGDSFEVGLFGSQLEETLKVEPVGQPGLRASRYTSRAGVSAKMDPLSDALSEAIGPVTVHAIGGFECHTTDGPGGSSVCGVLEPFGRVGMHWRAASWFSVLGNLGRYARPPTLGELFGISPTIQGTASLNPEVGTGVDGGVRLSGQSDSSSGLWKGLGGYLEVFGFARWVDELVAYQRTSFGSVRPFNVGSARVQGVEVASGGSFLDHVVFELTATFLDPRDTSGNRGVVNDILPFRSRLVVSNRLELFTEPAVNGIGLNRVVLGGLFHHRSSRFADPAGLIVIAPHTTLDLELSGQFWDRRVTVLVAVRNVFDGNQFDTVGYPLPGRSIHGNVEVWY